jgi:4-amino-4-deoxy-L-arabinose transferase-like glycosyltransferase
MKKNQLFLLLLLLLAIFLRTYRASVLTGFYFDQGRDAKVIWDLWHYHRFFLIGPTTGIEGIFLGPLYYYVIAPFYLVGHGNPVAAAVGLAVICVAGIYVIYAIGRKYFTPSTGLLAATLITFSLGLVQSQRWLSNPTPLFLSSSLAVLALLKIVHGSKSGWVWSLCGLMLGVSLQFEAASAIFFLPATLVVLLLFRKSVYWSFTHLVHSAFAFLITLLPQLIFDLRHDHILVMAFRQFLLVEKSFVPSGSNFLPTRLNFYYLSFISNLTLDRIPAILISCLLLLFTVTVWRHLPKKPLTVLLIWMFTPMLLLLLYRGNYGYVWGYYFTGVYLVFMLLVAAILTYTYSSTYIPFRKGLVGLLVAYIVVWNGFHLYNYLRANPDGPTAIMLGSSLTAVDWVYQDAGSRAFNVDVYVPPVISHAYDYLFLWRGNTRYHRLPDSNQQPLLYTLYEVDPPHPERLEAWLTRQATYATPEATVRFGGVTIDRRHRI